MNDKLKNKILLRFEEFRAIPYIDTYVHSQKPFKFKCFCGNIEYSRTWATLCNSKIACVHCLKIEEKKVMFNARLKSVKSKILNICNKYGCVPEVNLYEGSKIPFPIKCRCGVNMERSWCSFDKKGKTPLCPECSLENSTEKSRENARIKILPKIIENCREYGATYMEGTYIGSSYPFKILCRCGEVTQKIWKNYTFNNGKMLCPKCKYALIPKGKDHHNWNSLLDPKDRGRDNECREWSKLILEKFKYTCAISGQVGGKLNSHHIYSYGKYPKFRTEIENGICLTKDIHKEFHKKYGNGKYAPNTFDQFAEFFKMKTGGTFTGIDVSASLVKKGG